ncbi:MAG: fatty acid CoA ligase family protein [Nitrospirales bacterium]|nr:fatty acid CoA ligase family protein [Nitrospirales bacterium]
MTVIASHTTASAESAPLNIAAHLPRMAGRHPDQPAVIHPKTGAQLTFRQLNEDCDRYAWGLSRLGIGRGTRTVLMVRPGLEFFSLTFALFKLGAVPVLIDPGMGRANLLGCIEEAAPEAFIAIPLAQAARVLRPHAFRTVRTAITVGRRWFWGGPTLAQVRESSWREFPCAPTRADDVAAILFTSGSTGAPKGVVYEHSMFDAQVRALRDHYGIKEGEVDLPAFPLFALFSVAMGVTVVIPDMDPAHPAQVDPTAFVAEIQAHRVTQSFGSPAIWDRVGRYCVERNLSLPSLTRVLMAGAPVSPAILERVQRILPGAADAHTPYGATEALPVSSITAREVLNETASLARAGKGTCVGKALPGIALRIIRISDEAVPVWDDRLILPCGEIGEIVVKGPVVTREYFQREQATALAKIPNGQSWWHRMGDVGYLDEHDRLWFCGRKTDRVRTAQGTLFTVPCEAIFNQHPGVFRSALVGIGPAGRQQPVIVIEPHPDKFPATPDATARFTDELLRLGSANPLTAGIASVLFHQAFPVDVRHNVKISRDKLALWTAKQLGEGQHLR